MKKLKLGLAKGVGEILSREELKKVLGGDGSGVYSCTCMLTTSSGTSYKIGVTMVNPSSENCSTHCKDACEGAARYGGDCASYTYSYVDASTGSSLGS